MKTIDEKTKYKIIYIVKAVIPNAKIYLFGSQAAGKSKEYSDIDIAVESKNKLSRFDIAEIKAMLEASRIICHVDVVDLNAVDIDFKNNILKNGIIWAD